MCADTQETISSSDGIDEKIYVEKIAVDEERLYPIAVGGAGSGDLIDVAIDEIIERAKSEKPATKKDLKKLVNASFERCTKKTCQLSLFLGSTGRRSYLSLPRQLAMGSEFFIRRGEG
jgi:hypothetical protein